MYKKTFKLSFSKWAAAATTTTPDVCICLIGGKNESLIFCSQDISIERRQIYSRTKCIQKQNYSLKKNRHYWNCIYQLQIAMRNNIYFLFLLCIKATALITYAYIIYIYIGGASRRANSARHFFVFLQCHQRYYWRSRAAACTSANPIATTNQEQKAEITCFRANKLLYHKILFNNVE